MTRVSLLLSTSLMAFAVLGQTAYAQTAAPPTNAQSTEGGDQVEDVVVTSERRVSTAQRTAAAISVRSGEDLLQQGRFQLRDILEDVPGVVGGAAFAANTAKGSGSDNPGTGLTIRGIQSNSGTGGNAIPAPASAAIYVDDVYNGIGGNFDINRVEVLRGPQGTLYGRSAVSGVVAIYTGDPDASGFGASGTVELGDYSLRHYTGSVNVPLVTDKLAVRLSGNHYERDGYYSAAGGALETSEFRVKALWTPTENFAALFGYARQDNTTNSGGVSIRQGNTPTDFIQTPQIFAESENNFEQYWANFYLKAGPVAINYIPALRTWTQDALFFSRQPGFNINQRILVPDDDFITHEIRIRNTDDEARLRWQAGLLYYDNAIEISDAQINQDPAPNPQSSLTKKSTIEKGVFAEATYDFTPETRLTVGLRYDHTEIQVDQVFTAFVPPAGEVTRTLNGAAGLREFDAFNYKLRLEHDITPVNLVYGSISTGSSPGDVSLGATPPTYIPAAQTLDSQSLTAYEIGSKNRFLGNRLQLNGAVFYYDYEGYQAANINLNTSTIPPFPTGFPPLFQTFSLPLTTYGAELELVARPWDNGTISFNAAYTHARYTDFGTNGALFASDEVPNVAPIEASAAYDHVVPIGNTTLLLRGSVRYFSEHDRGRVTDAEAAIGGAPFVRVDSQFITDLNATWLFGERYSLTAYVRNVTDEQYLPENWNVRAVSRRPDGSIFVDSDNPALSDPRTVGLVLSFNY